MEVMNLRRAGIAAASAACVVLLTAGAAAAQQCVVDGLPVPGQECPSPTPTPSPTRTKTPSPTPSPTRTRTSTPTPRPTESLIIVPPIVPIPTPSVQGSFGPDPAESTPPPWQGPIDTSFAATRPGLPVVPSDGRGFTALIVGMLGASGAGAYALARSRVRAWMIGI